MALFDQWMLHCPDCGCTGGAPGRESFRRVSRPRIPPDCLRRSQNGRSVELALELVPLGRAGERAPQLPVVNAPLAVKEVEAVHPVRVTVTGQAPGGRGAAAGGESTAARVNRIIQLGSHVPPPSRETACSNPASVGLMSVHTRRR